MNSDDSAHPSTGELACSFPLPPLRPLLTGIGVILVWQAMFLLAGPQLDPSFRIHVIGYGGSELAHLFLPLPSLWLGAEAPGSIKPCNIVLVLGGLCALYAAFWRHGRWCLGALIVLLVGSNPSLLYETYANENIFAWPLGVAMWALALNLRLLLGPTLSATRIHNLLLAAVGTGAILGVAKFVRTDAIGVGLTVGLLYLLSPYITHKARALVIAAAAIGFFTIYTTPNIINQVKHGEWSYSKRGHPLWFPMWTGLGDFDRKYGHLWDDLTSHAYARPIFFQRTGKVAGSEWDPEYGRVFRDGYIERVKNDPGWWLGIIARRCWRVIGENTPARISFYKWYLPFPIPATAMGLGCILLVGGLAVRRRWHELGIVLFTAPTAVAAILVYSGHGIAYYANIHLFALAVALHLAIERFMAKRPAPANDPGTE